MINKTQNLPNTCEVAPKHRIPTSAGGAGDSRIISIHHGSRHGFWEIPKSVAKRDPDRLQNTRRRCVSTDMLCLVGSRLFDHGLMNMKPIEGVQ